MKKIFAGASLTVAALCAMTSAAQTSSPSAVESAMIKAVDAQTPAANALLEKLVNINSGTLNLAGVVAVKDVVMPQIEALGFKARWESMEQIGRAGDLVAEHACPAGTGKCGKRILLIGHLDTVFEPASSFQKYSIVPGTDGNVAMGPGVNDMKGGLVVMLTALKAMKAAGTLDNAEIRIVLSGDEERHGSPVSLSRRDMIDAAKKSDVALEFESGGRIDGKDVQSISRRSAGTWKLETTGRSGHSSGVFGDRLGDGAIYEMARILDAFRKELKEPGLTYNAGLVLGGSTAKMNESGTAGEAAGKNNVVPPVAIATGDFRTLDNDQTARVEAKMRQIVADHLPRTGATITFDEGYPAMAATEAGHALVRQLNEVNAALGLPAMEEMDPTLRGAGDIAFVAPYIPGLVGTGAMGGGAHAEGETVQLDSIPRQAKRMALFMYRLSKE
ncbi:MAG: M20/M25/M40 family metallo-hydrolase [Acidobacteria bacterium]|nr:M20/M25/M40 family metallo-hydrolase [Acidobacteriota bacterium]